jgi:ABC-type Fe3+/spermidine/putrescine transport system ATPase subunit/ABC-type spermidine/putrescine transport system permease subunit II
MSDDHLLSTRGRSVLFIYGWIVLFFIMAPVLVLVPISFSAENAFVFPPTDFSLAWYDVLVEDPRWSSAAILSLKVATVATILSILIGVPAAIGMSRMSARYGRLVKLLFVAPMVVPVMVIGVAFYVLYAKVGLLGSFLSIAVAHTILIMPFVVIPVMARLLSLDPALERAAASLGAGPYRTIYAIIVPLLGPAIAASFVFAFLHSFDEVVMAQFLSGPRLETLPRRMWEGIAIGGLDKTITSVTTIQIFVTILLLGGIALWRRQPKLALVSAMSVPQYSKHFADATSEAPNAVPSPALHRKEGNVGVGITFERLSMNYGKHGGGQAFSLDDFSLHVEPGEFLTILGPSGSGKTTVLMLIAGFISADSGRLLLGNRDISAIPPHQRDLGVVFQNYSLFPHFNVRRNLAFPLEVRNVPKAEINRRVDWALSLVHMEGFAERRITQLSGGQQQRVALARAIIFNPRALLMDEPLAALDRNLRIDMQREIRSLTRSLGQTVIYVTHDQEEALNLSDRIAVMDKGELQQVATPRDIYLKPRNSFVAGFFGEANLVNGMAQGNKLVLGSGVQVPLPETRAGKAILCIRPEVVRADLQPNSCPVQLKGTVIETRFQGSILRTRVQTDVGEIVSVSQTTSVQVPPQLGSIVNVSWEPEHTHVMDH